jgi:hypothetical protein
VDIRFFEKGVRLRTAIQRKHAIYLESALSRRVVRPVDVFDVFPHLAQKLLSVISMGQTRMMCRGGGVSDQRQRVYSLPTGHENAGGPGHSPKLSTPGHIRVQADTSALDRPVVLLILRGLRHMVSGPPRASI